MGLMLDIPVLMLYIPDLIRIFWEPFITLFSDQMTGLFNRNF